VRNLQGQLKERLTVQLFTDRFTVDQSLDVSRITATNADGQPIALDPIILNAAFTSHGGEWTAPELRDLSLDYRSGFGSGDIKARNLGELRGQAAADLAEMQQSVSQFYDFKEIK